jgi:glycogen operon protein
MPSTVQLARDVPRLLGGDELGRTRGGNNNTSCHDNEITWFDWSAVDGALRDFTASLIGLRRAHPALRRRGYPADPDAVRWFRPDRGPDDR